MSSNITFNGVTYAIPNDGDFNWGPDLTAYFIAIASGALQKTGGTFTLGAETDFGAAFGLKSLYFKSRHANPAAAGQFRLGNTESISWRNNANSADLALTSNASDALLFNSKNVLFSNLGLIVNVDVSASAAVAYSKLNLATSIVNTDINASAAIAYSKLAALTASRLLVSDGSGFVSISAVTETESSYLAGVTSAIQTQMNLKAPLASPTFTGTVIVPATITAPSSVVITLPTSTATLATRALAETLTNKTIDADANTITNIENTDIKAAAAIALNKLAATTASRALASDGSGFVSPATTTLTELNLINESLAHQSYTPVISGSSTAGAGTYTTQAGGYAQFGKVVYFWFNLLTSAHTGTGNYQISLPKAAITFTNYRAAVNIGYIDSVTSPASTYVTALISSGSSILTIQSATVAGGTGSGLAIDAVGSIQGSGWYLAA